MNPKFDLGGTSIDDEESHRRIAYRQVVAALNRRRAARRAADEGEINRYGVRETRSLASVPRLRLDDAARKAIARELGPRDG